MEKNLPWLKTKKVIVSFAIISLIGGIIFLDKSFTGNVILSNTHPFNFISFIGLLLILCSIILIAYLLKKG